MIKQTIQIKNEKIDRAFKYYSILSILYSLKLKNKQLELLAFTAVRGTITPPSARAEFIQKFDSSKDSLNNLKSQLTRKGLIIKENGMDRVNPKIAMDFNHDTLLQIHLSGHKTEPSEGSSNTEADSGGDS